MTRGIGWYVHHQGAGHLHRARLVAAALPRPCTLIGTLAGLDARGLGSNTDLLDLPDDRPLGATGFDGADGAADRPRALHYAPLDHPGVRARMAGISAWAARTEPALLVVDVSVEVAMLARLLSVPTVVVRLAGTRTDAAHLDAFRGAVRLLAPFPEALEGERAPGWVRAKTLYAGFLGAAPAGAGEDGAGDDIVGGDIVVVFGRGGAGGRLADLAAAARAVPDRRWHVLGPVDGAGAGAPNLSVHGWVADVEPYIARAALLVGGAGDGLVALAAAHAKRFVCLPEPRAYDEQTVKAEAFARRGAAVVRAGWPDASDWPGLIEAGLALDPRAIARLWQPDAVAACAEAIETVARAFDPGARSLPTR